MLSVVGVDATARLVRPDGTPLSSLSRLPSLGLPAVAVLAPVQLLRLDIAHQAAAAVWLGGIAMVALELRRLEPSEAQVVAERFSTVARWAVLVLVATGLVSTFRFVDSVSAIFDQQWLAVMVAHHQGAVAMAEAVATKGRNAEVEALAAQVIAAQQAEIAEMNGLLRT